MVAFINSSLVEPARDVVGDTEEQLNLARDQAADKRWATREALAGKLKDMRTKLESAAASEDEKVAVKGAVKGALQALREMEAERARLLAVAQEEEAAAQEGACEWEGAEQQDWLNEAEEWQEEIEALEEEEKEIAALRHEVLDLRKYLV